MGFFVYIIKSLADQSYYKGFTETPIIRLERHNNGESRYTKNKLPWDLVYLECFEQKKDALIREKSNDEESSDSLLKKIFLI
jgi:putative endonuclease